MNIPFLTRFCKRRKMHKLRGIMRGYAILKNNGQLGLIRKVKKEFADTILDQVTPRASHFFFGAAKEQAEQVTRQYLLLRNTGITLHKALLYSIGSGNSKIVYPLPKKFRQVLTNNDFNVSHERSSIAWIWNVILLWCFGIASIVKHFYKGVRELFSPAPLPAERYAYFTGLRYNNLPRPTKDGISYDTVTWYTKWNGAAPNLSALYHDTKGTPTSYLDDKKVAFREQPFPEINNLTDLIRFFLWSIGAIILSAIDILRGRWWNAFLLPETAKATVTRFSKPGQLAVDYLFDNSDTVYRPIWTYEAEQKGARIISYFYSTFEDFKLPSGYQPNSTYWQAMNWPLYVVWDDYQQRLIQRNINEHANVAIVGPIWLSSSPIELPEIPVNAVAVFDIPPIKNSLHFGFSTIAELDYGNPLVPVKFIHDIETALSKYGGTIIHKRKRKSADNHLHKGYTRVLTDLARENKLISIEADTSPIPVIEKCKAVISMPFTSTAIMGRELGKPSVYYDPIGVIQKDDKGAHGIQVISNENELQEWMEKVFSS